MSALVEVSKSGSYPTFSTAGAPAPAFGGTNPRAPHHLPPGQELTCDKQKRAACSGDGILVAELSDGVISDALNRTGYIASNYQFQFDRPPQSGALYTAGFSHCSNGSLALGGSAVFYQCRSGSFYNLYDRWWAEQCSPVEILVMPCGGESDNDGAVDGNDEGQHVVATSTVLTTVVVPLGDGQPQVVTTMVPICQIVDGMLLRPSRSDPAARS